MKECWYQGNTGIGPLDNAIKKAIKLGYNHHIERLMIIANLMNLARIDPKEVYIWFMEYYVDSSDWVMAPNVYGMGLYSDGGIFSTKPYICGSSYILKMSDYKKGEWTDIVDGLYWKFIDENREKLKRNPRIGIMTKMIDNMELKRKKRIFKAANIFLSRTTEDFLQ
jgi:deoxyribodipyrimidine photolyase-related protein